MEAVTTTATELQPIRTVRRKKYYSLAAAGVSLVSCVATAPAIAATCPVSASVIPGVEPPMFVDSDCIDPDYNEKTLVIDSTTEKSLTLPDGSTIGYQEVRGHFPALKTEAQLPPGITQSPTTSMHGVFWRFPEKRMWQHRFFMQTYPLPQEFLNEFDSRFAFTHGGYTVGTIPGNPNVGYRVIAAAAKLAKAYANRYYANTGRIYGYIYGMSGGSVQLMGATEGTSGVWDGIIPVVIATDALPTHSFMWDSLYALRVPQAKRDAISKAVAPGSGRDIYDALTADEHAALNELLSAGFARKALEGMQFNVEAASLGIGGLSTYDPTYADDFWSKPGYEGANPPAYLAAAKVDGSAKITAIARNAQNQPAALTFDAATLPALGSIGTAGLQYHVSAVAGRTGITQGEASSLSGKLSGNQLTLDDKNDPVMLQALTVGGTIRIDNRLFLAALFYPRHSLLDNGNPAYNQYRNADGTPKYPQRTLQAAYYGSVRSAGGRRETGHLKNKTIVLENLSDPASYPYVGSFYNEMVQKALGSKQADSTFRLYYQQNATHGASTKGAPGKAGTTLAAVGGILNQSLLDFSAWVEHGVAPLSSTRYARDAMNQVTLPESPGDRRGMQPVMQLTANGKERAIVGVNQPVELSGTITMPPGAGKVVRYDWYLGGCDFKFEPATTLPSPQTSTSVLRKVSFGKPGEYEITLRADGERDGADSPDSQTRLENLARVRIVVQ